MEGTKDLECWAGTLRLWTVFKSLGQAPNKKWTEPACFHFCYSSFFTGQPEWPFKLLSHFLLTQCFGNKIQTPYHACKDLGLSSPSYSPSLSIRLFFSVTVIIHPPQPPQLPYFLSQGTWASSVLSQGLCTHFSPCLKCSSPRLLKHWLRLVICGNGSLDLFT